MPEYAWAHICQNRRHAWPPRWQAAIPAQNGTTGSQHSKQEAPCRVAQRCCHHCLHLQQVKSHQCRVLACSQPGNTAKPESAALKSKWMQSEQSTHVHTMKAGSAQSRHIHACLLHALLVPWLWPGRRAWQGSLPLMPLAWRQLQPGARRETAAQPCPQAPPGCAAPSLGSSPPLRLQGGVMRAERTH